VGDMLRSLARGLAGHSKWHNTRFRKARQDAVKLEVASKFAGMIRVAVGAGDEAGVADAVARAKKEGVTREVIERALETSRNREAYKEEMYEGSLAGGVLVLVEALTDNPRRTAPKVRHLFKEGGGALGAAGSAAWAFQRRGLLRVQGISSDNEALIEAALEAGAQDVEEDSAAHLEADDGPCAAVFCEPNELAAVRATLSARGFEASEAAILFVPSTTAEPAAGLREAAESALLALEEMEDVEGIWHNLAP